MAGLSDAAATAAKLAGPIKKVVDRRDLSEDESYRAMLAIMSGEATDAQIAGFITALRMKGETAEEITGCARAMREKATKIDPGPSPHDVLDTCGTGGTGRSTFNISTAAALIVAGAGVKVAKHGNRSVRIGSADVLKELGVNLDATPAVVEHCLREANIGFLFAPKLHAAMKFAIGPRRELGIRTVFNILGPLTNPAGAKCQLLGVYDEKLTGVMANVLRMLGSKHCFVVHAADGLDEISTTSATHVAELADGAVREYEIEPQQFGVPTCAMGDLCVHSVQESAVVIRAVLAGEQGCKRDIALLNAAAGLAAAGAAKDIQEGLKLAAESVDKGRAGKALERLVLVSNEAV